MKVKRYLAAWLLVLPCLLAAQNEIKQHQFGISFEAGSVFHTGEADEINTVPLVEKEKGFQFALGILHHWQLNHALAFRSQAMIRFIETDAASPEILIEDYQTDLVVLSFPVHVLLGLTKVKFEPYVVLGGRYELEIAEDRAIELPDFNKDNTFAIDMGIGMTFDFEKYGFRMRPELLTSFGVTNLWETTFERNDLRRNMVSFRLIFQG